MDTLYYGDNLEILREHVRDETVDLVYLDPPFNSNASCNVLFRTPERPRKPCSDGSLRVHCHMLRPEAAVLAENSTDVRRRHSNPVLRNRTTVRIAQVSAISRHPSRP